MIKVIQVIAVMFITSTVILGISKYKISDKTNTVIDTIKYLDLPVRSEGAVSGSQFAKKVTGLSLINREKAVVEEILSGNVPTFSRKLKPITRIQLIDTINYEVTFYTTCDYMAIGSDEDFLYIPMTPSTAQYLADVLDCSLPTKKMVDLIYNNSDVKLTPQPIPPSDAMTTIPVFMDHTDSIKRQISNIEFDRSLNSIIAGHKKDIIISNKIYSNDRDYDRVVIYGWHLSIGNPIQPVYNGHGANYADYSHGVRLNSNVVIVDGDTTTFSEILSSYDTAVLLSSEGKISKSYYPPSDVFVSVKSKINNLPNEFILEQNYPNPFNNQTRIEFNLVKDELVIVEIYDIIGRKIENLYSDNMEKGEHFLYWTPQNESSGVYFCKIKLGSETHTQKMILLK